MVYGVASLVVLLAPLGSVQAYPALQSPPANSNAARISGGVSHTCALTTAAAGVLCWSDNTFNQLGDGTTTFRAQPTAVAGLTNDAIALGAGDQDTCAVLADGGVTCWGANDFGALGDGTTTDRASPVAVVGLGGSATAVTLRCLTPVRVLYRIWLPTVIK